MYKTVKYNIKCHKKLGPRASTGPLFIPTRQSWILMGGACCGAHLTGGGTIRRIIVYSSFLNVGYEVYLKLSVCASREDRRVNKFMLCATYKNQAPCS